MNKTTKRRPRYRRDRAFRCDLNLTERDLKTFELLSRYRYLRSTFSWQLLKVSTDHISFERFIDRLGLLYQNGYLNVPGQQLQYANARYLPNVHELDKKAEQALIAHGRRSPEIVALNAAARRSSNRQFSHRLMISDIVASIEIALHDHPRIRLIDFDEIIAAIPKQTKLCPRPMAMPTTVRLNGKVRKFECEPDALFGLEYTEDSGEKLYRFFALEADRGTEPVYFKNIERSSFLLKYLAYRDIAANKTYASHFGLPNLLVLTITVRRPRMETMTKLIEEQTGRRGSAMFCFKTIGALGDFQKAPTPDGSIFTAPWERAGKPPFDMSLI